MKKLSGILLSIILLGIFPLSLKDRDIELTKSFNIPDPIPPEQILLDNMTNEEKVGQLFIFGIEGTTLTKEEEDFLADNHIGGILLLGKNISNEQQLKQLILDIQSTNNIPLFISIDQEGGKVSRITWDSRLTKAQKDIQNYNDSYITAKERGEYLKELGINMNLAPVVEYITDEDSFMYDRVYRGSKEQVIQKSIGAVRGYIDADIIPVPKHYPGHDNNSSDSHTSLPVVNIEDNQWNEYIQVFKEIIEETNVNAIMAGHVKYPNIDNNPSSLSYEILTKRLVQDLGYTGLIISDDMCMGAVKNTDTLTNTAKKALLAGNDILIYSTSQISIQEDIYNYILKEVNNGNMDIDGKVLKILRIKIKHNIRDTI
jgi:beta-N-acetylhexosaminidase